jgi:hypothetical protein
MKGTLKLDERIVATPFLLERRNRAKTPSEPRAKFRRNDSAKKMVATPTGRNKARD